MVDNCGRCGGKGWGPWRPHGGICYRCWGRGYVLGPEDRLEWLQGHIKALTAKGKALRADVEASPSAEKQAVLVQLRAQYRKVRMEMARLERELPKPKPAPVHCPPLTEEAHTVMVSC